MFLCGYLLICAGPVLSWQSCTRNSPRRSSVSWKNELRRMGKWWSDTVAVMAPKNCLELRDWIGLTQFNFPFWLKPLLWPTCNLYDPHCSVNISKAWWSSTSRFTSLSSEVWPSNQKPSPWLGRILPSINWIILLLLNPWNGASSFQRFPYFVGTS